MEQSALFPDLPTTGNPYPKEPGFSQRVRTAAAALRRLAHNPWDRRPVKARTFDNCFEMYDGDAVAWELMDMVMRGDQELEAGLEAWGPNILSSFTRVYPRRSFRRKRR
jgi:hypothetical protein